MIFSSLILHEPVAMFRWIAASIGVVGAALIIKPAFLDLNISYLVALLGTSLNGLAFVLNKHLQRVNGDSELTTMFYINAVPVVCTLPALVTVSMPEIEVLPWLSGVLLFGPVGMYLGIVAVRYADASALAPYALVRLVIAAVGGIVIFHELPNTFSVLGAAMIVTSCLLAVAPASESTRPRTA